MDKPQLIRLIHIAKNKLGLDDETYRTKLQAIAGKTSCKGMTLAELNDVYQSFKDAGFKRTFNKKAHVRRDSTGKTKAPEIPKIRAIWIAMHEQGFVTSSSETSLNNYVMRMTKRINGLGVAEVGWLDEKLAYRVLEALKAWHLRLINDVLKERRIAIPNDKHGKPLRLYGPLSEMYARIVQHDTYLNSCRESNKPMKTFSFPCCGFRTEAVTPPDRAEKWDSVICCPVCMKQYHRTVTCTGVILRGAR